MLFTAKFLFERVFQLKRSKLLSILLAALIVMSSFSCLSVVSFAATVASGTVTDADDNEVTAWELDSDGTLTVFVDCEPVGWAPYAADVKAVVFKPEVTAIPDLAFYHFENLASVDFNTGSAIERIGKQAFEGCISLDEIVMPNSVTFISDYAFYGCSSLVKATLSLSLAGDVNKDGEVIGLGKNIFKGCSALETVVVPNGCKIIGYGMFEDCTSLTTIALPDSIEGIADHAFDGCSALEDIIVPDSAVAVGDYAFYGCSAAKTAYIGHNAEFMGEYAFGKCTSLEEVTFTSEFDAISEWMFYGCTSLKTIVDFPEGVKLIGAHAFENCAALDNVVVPNTVTSIGEAAFSGCAALTSIKLNNALTSIGKSAFYGTSLTTIDIPYLVSTIDIGAFSSCDKLEAINVAENNTVYCSVDGVLYNAAKDTLLLCPAGKSGEVVVPASVDTIDSKAFLGCELLTTVTIPGTVTTIGASAFNGCNNALVIKTPCTSAAATFAKIHSIDTELIHSAQKEWVVTIQPGCEAPGEKSEKCPDCGLVYTTETLAPTGHDYTETVTKAPTCEDDGEATFTCKTCGHTHTATIPALGHDYDTVGVITKEATCDEDGVRTHYCKNDGCDEFYTTAIPATDHDMDAGTVTLAPTCTENGIRTYKCKHNNCDHSTTEEIPATGHNMETVGTVTKEPTCTELGERTFKCRNKGCSHYVTESIPMVPHNYDEGAITVYPTVNKNGVITYTCKDCGHTKEESVSNIAFDGILATNKGAYADENGEFQNLSWLLTDSGILVLYKDVTANEWSAYGSMINTVIVTGETTTINNSAFTDYPALEEVVFAKTLSKIGAGAFQNCDKLTVLDIAGTTSIEDYAFYDCDGLTDVTIYGGLAADEVGKCIFKSCDNLTNLEIKNGAIEIGESMFEDCVSLKTALLPDSICLIGRLAFENCKSLEAIMIPDSVQSVGEYAFYDCASAKTLYLGHDLKNVEKYAFGRCIALEDVTIHCAMPVISEGMFYGCTSLKGLPELPDGIETIGANAFAGCSAFEEIVLPSTVNTIGDSAFDGTALKVINIPASVDTIENGAFTNCTALEAINVDTKNDNYFSVDGVLYDMSLAALILCPSAKAGEVSVWNGTEAIDKDAFIGCDKLTKVYIPDTVTEIADNAFNGCSKDLVIVADCDSYAIEFAKFRGIAFEEVHPGGFVWTITLEATCDVDGLKERTCVSCDYVYETQTIEALGHSFDTGTITKRATCDEAGVVTFSCVREGCDHFYTEDIPAIGHIYNDGVVTVKPTCDTEGTKKFSCTNDGCYDSYTTVVPATGHKLDAGKVTKEATCEEDGVKTYTCQNADCNYKETEAIPAIGHNYVESVAKTATCVEAGIKKYTCDNCGDEYTESFMGEHVPYSTPQTKNPTCTEDGEKGTLCSVCHQFIGETTVIPATGHNYKNGACTDCGIKDNSVKPGTPKLEKAYNTFRGPIIRWESVKNADHYNVYAKVEGGKWSKIATVEADTNTSYIHTDAKSGKTYTYSVSAVNGSIEGAYNKTGLTLLYLATPIISSLKTTTKGVQVEWNKIKGADAYRIYRRTSGTDWERVGTVKGNATVKFVDETAKNGQSYIYIVRAYSNKTLSSYYPDGEYITFVSAPELSSVKATSTGAKLVWEDVKGADKYIVYRKTSSGSYKKLAVVSGDVNSYKDTTVKNGKYYRYTVRAVIDGAQSAYETGLKIKFISTPKLKSVTPKSSGVVFKFSEVSTATDYIIYRKTAKGSWKKIGTCDSGRYVDKTAKAGVKYSYTVRATDGKYTSYYNTKGLTCTAK